MPRARLGSSPYGSHQGPAPGWDPTPGLRERPKAAPRTGHLARGPFPVWSRRSHRAPGWQGGVRSPLPPQGVPAFVSAQAPAQDLQIGPRPGQNSLGIFPAALAARLGQERPQSHPRPPAATASVAHGVSAAEWAGNEMQAAGLELNFPSPSRVRQEAASPGRPCSQGCFGGSCVSPGAAPTL